MKISSHHITICWLTVVFFLFGCHSKTSNKAFFGLQNLPPFTMISLDSSRILKSETIPKGKSIVLILFDPTCEHCQQLTEAIVKNNEKLQNVRFYLVSDADPGDIDTFINSRHLDKFSNIYVGRDYEFSFDRAFTPSSVPYVAIYNSDKRLSRIFNGDINIESIVNQTRY